jgi:hypothetical protein
MEHLTKQQIVLLTLLVSFITSLSTGIVTVSLMDQSPTVTKTVNQIIEKTIASPQTAAVGLVSISVQDQVASATARVSSSTVRIKDASGTTIGLGIIISKTGAIMTDRNMIDQTQTYSATLSNGVSVPLSLSISNNTTGEPIFLIPTASYTNGSPITFVPATVVSGYGLGQKIFSLSSSDPSSDSLALGEGLITQVGTTSIATSIPGTGTVGAPLFDIQGNIIGMQASSTFIEIAPLIPVSNVL